MNKPKFTPGPWEMSYDTGSTRDIITAAGSLPIGSVRVSYVGEGEYHANAHLIAAAPELYEAARRALSSLNSVLRHRNAIVNFDCIEYERDMLAAALSKARGEV